MKYPSINIGILILGILLFQLHSIKSQKPIHLSLIGNTAEADPDLEIFKYYRNYVKSLPKKHTYLVGLGDYSDKNGFSNKPGNLNQSRLEILDILDKQVNNSIILAGDRDWDDSGENGLKKNKDLEKYLEDLLGKKTRFIKNGCPGPETIEFNDNHVVVAINSQWFIHPFEKPQFPNTDCDISTSLDFWEELEDILEDYNGKRIIIIGHHPVYGTGRSTGRQLGHLHWLPIVGSFINSFHKNIGRPSDLAHPNYQAYANRMKHILANHSNVLFISGHDHNTELIKIGNNHFLNTGNMIKDQGSDITNNHIVKIPHSVATSLALNPNKSIDVHFISPDYEVQTVAIPWINIEKAPITHQFDKTRTDSTSVIAGQEYKASGFSKFWMGDHYRNEWTTKVKVPNLYLDTIYGGLIPYAKGGGLQTNSLKLKAPDGSKYSFRSINKNPERALSREVRQTIYKHLVKDLITTQHPYGGLAASFLLDHTDILHARPRLFYLPPQPQLGQYNNDFGGGFGTLELKPSEKSNPPFAQADDIVSSHQMIHALYEYDDHKVDKNAYARARVFDMWMGDWDRHEDNWKWAAYKSENKTIYKPIPRDRDHVFSQWEGVIPSVADMIIPNAEHFDYSFKNLKHLNWKARHLDRQLGNELTGEDWKAAATYLQSKIDSNIIVQSLQQVPVEIRSFSNKEISEKLINRLKELPEAVFKNYKLLAKEVDVPGSNKKEKFYISDESEGVLIHVVDEGNTIYRRLFLPEETKVINLYGLEGKDEFILNMKKRSSIKIRMMCGDGKDEIIDNYPQVDKKINIYDKYEKNDVNSYDGIRLIKSIRDPKYDSKWFDYPAIFPFVGFKNSSGNGFGIQAVLNASTVGFNKPDYAHQWGIEGIFYPSLKAHHIDAYHKYRHIWRDWDARSSLIISSFYSKYPFFYGVGNETERDEELAEENHYRIDYNTVKLKSGLSKSFLRKSFVYIHGIYEYNNIKDAGEDALFFLTTPEFQERGQQNVVGIGIDLDINFKDNDLFTTQGSQFLGSWRSNFSTFGNFTQLSGQLAHFQSYNLLSKTTFILKTGGSTVIGDAPFYQLSTLGSNSNLRGHVRNRFVDRSAIYYNTEIRMHVGTWRTVIAPLKYGIFFLHDSGKVFDGALNFNGSFNSTYGGGFYIAPLSESYSLVFTIARSDDRENYARLEFGWRL